MSMRIPYQSYIIHLFTCVRACGLVLCHAKAKQVVEEDPLDRRVTEVRPRDGSALACASLYRLLAVAAVLARGSCGAAALAVQSVAGCS